MSLSIGAHVYKRLSDSTELAKLVTDKIYAISTKTETSFPFVIYKRSSLVPEYTKDRYGTGDTVSVEVVVASDNYLNSITIAEEVRNALENKRGSYDSFDVIDAKLMSADEDFIEDTFIQCLVFSCKLGLSAETIDTQSKDSGIWTEKDIKKLSWNASSDNLFSADADANSYDKLFALFIAHKPITLNFGIVANANENEMPVAGWTLAPGSYTGKAVITSLEANAPDGDKATFSISFEGTGPLKKETTVPASK